MTRHLPAVRALLAGLLVLLTAGPGRAQFPLPTYPTATPTPTPQASPTAATATLSTTARRALEERIVSQREALDERLRSTKATAASTRTTTVPGLAEVLDQQIQSLELTRSVLSQQQAALQQTGQLVLLRQQVEGQLTRLRQSGMEEPPPYPLPRLDQLRSELQGERARRAALEASLATSRAALAAAVTRERIASEELAAAREAHAANPDVTRAPALHAAVQASEARLQQAEGIRRLREFEASNDELQLTIQQLRTTLLEEREQWMRKDLAFRQQDLETQHQRIDREAFALQRSLEAARLELASSERRWSAARQRLDSLDAPDEVATEEVQTRFLELQARQREVVLLEARVRRLQESKEVWATRLRIHGRDLDEDSLERMAAENQQHLEELQREQRLQESRIDELQKDLQALTTRRDALSPSSTRLARLLRERQGLLLGWVQAGRDNLAGIQAQRELRRRLDEELRSQQTVRQDPWWEQAWERLRDGWTTYLGPWAEPLVKILLLLFVGMPLNFFLSRRVQGVTARLYSAQSGMIAGKIVYYGGITLILFMLLNTVGVGLAPLIGAAGVTGVALGFASQASVSNIISGLFLIAEQPFKVDDIIVVGDITGVVLSVDLLSVKLRQFDNKFTRIPNETILRSNVTNISRHPIRRVETSVSVVYASDMERVEELLMQVAQEHPKVLANPEPLVIFQGFKDSGIDYKLCVWGDRLDFLFLLNAVPRAIKERFDAEGIEIPFPHLSLYRGARTEPFEVRLLRSEAGEAPPASPERRPEPAAEELPGSARRPDEEPAEEDDKDG